MVEKLVTQMAKKGFSLTLWGRSRGFSHSDIVVLRDLANGKTKGAYGRSREIRKMLENEGFKFSVEPKIKPHFKRRKFVNLDSVGGNSECGFFANAQNDIKNAQNDIKNAQNDSGYEVSGSSPDCHKTASPLLDCFVATAPRNDGVSENVGVVIKSVAHLGGAIGGSSNGAGGRGVDSVAVGVVAKTHINGGK